MYLKNHYEKESSRKVYRYIHPYYYGNNASHDEIIEEASSNLAYHSGLEKATVP